MFAVYKRELRSFFTTPVGYVFAAVFLAFSGGVFAYTTLYQLSSDTTLYFTVLMLSAVVLLPLLTMRSFSEEKRAKTEQLLLSSPVRISAVVFAKFLAAYTVFAGCMLLTSLNHVILFAHAQPSAALILGNVFATLLLGGAFIAIGVFVSSLTESQLSAAVLTVAILVFLLLIGYLGSLVSVSWVRFLLSGLSVFARYQNFANGIFDIAAVVYYLSLTALFLFFTVRVFERRRLS